MAAVAGLLLLLPQQSHSQTRKPETDPRSGSSIIGIVTADGGTVLTNMGAYTYTPAPVAEPPRQPLYLELIEDISRSYGIDPALTRAVVEVESSFDPRAVSSRGALGLMQLIPTTGQRFGVSNFFDPADNIGGGVRFLRFLIDKFDGNADLVLAAYNSGENRVERLGRVPAIPETINYVREVRAAYERVEGAALGPLLRIMTGSTNENVGRAIYTSVDERGVATFSGFGTR